MAMQLTRAGEYAVRSLVYLATQQTDARVMASEVATAENIPVNFVRKILESLAKTGLVKSFRGAGGGFTLGRGAEQISLRQVIEAVEGPLALNQCLVPNPCENFECCPLSQVWQEAQHAVEGVLNRYSLHDIATARAKRRVSSTEKKRRPVPDDHRAVAP
jgi:Rrf2 family protein